MTAVNDLPAGMREQLRLFRELLVRWNQRFNLTSIDEPGEVDRRLIGDALRILPAIDEAIAGFDGVPRLIDVGAGAGFPGIVLKVVRPQIDLTLLEATGKKVGFLEAALVELGLGGARAIHGRAEETARLPHHREQYSVVTARGVASLPALMELCMPFLQTGGQGLFPKGADLGSELEEGARAAQIVGARIDSAEMLPTGPGENVTRLVVAAKIGATPDRYPRRSGIPAKEPLGRIEG